MSGKYRLSTLGCKVNQYESQEIRQLLGEFGLKPAQAHETPDIAIVNTCAVTATALRKSRQVIRRIIRDHRTDVIVVGCAAGDAEHLSAIHGVVASLGHDVDIRAELRTVLAEHFLRTLNPSNSESADTSRAACERPGDTGDDIWMSPSSSDPTSQAQTHRRANSPPTILPIVLPAVKSNGALTTRIDRFVGRQRAYLKVQDGCDAFCTYCIVPSLRPELRWKPIDVAVAEAGDLVRAGHKEIIVTGVCLGAYGRDSAIRGRFPRNRSPLADLVAALAGIEGLERLRLSSMEPGDLDRSLLEVLASRDNCVPHLHLPLQSGSAEVLRRMNRQYTPSAFLEMVERARAAMDRPAITTDIIVGFPGETEEDFQATLAIAGRVGFAKIHAFPFSPRRGTAAARWQQQYVAPPLVRERLHRLGQLERECSLAFRQAALGTVERVIVEGRRHGSADASPADSIRHGRTDRYFEIHFEAQDAHPGDVVSVRVERVTPTRTHGSQVRYTPAR